MEGRNCAGATASVMSGEPAVSTLTRAPVGGSAYPFGKEQKAGPSASHEWPRAGLLEAEERAERPISARKTSRRPSPRCSFRGIVGDGETMAGRRDSMTTLHEEPARRPRVLVAHRRDGFSGGAPVSGYSAVTVPPALRSAECRLNTIGESLQLR